ncbi:MAG TPA: ABC transporter ATP-binding protein, partial [Candidatus Tectomicrobia bacterium]|nr:ABC transporter ATP-binding protein [Candidatus Tectomicrobia bacterium]
MAETVIAVRNLSKRYTRGPDPVRRFRERLNALTWAPYRRLRGRPAPVIPRRETFWALRDLTFDVARGERVGIIGRNGAGKSTLLKILSRIVYPTEGEARIRGRVTSLLEVGTGFNPDLTGRENVYLNASLHGLHRHEIDARFEEIVEFSGVRDFIETPVRHYSSGMFMRLAFSVAAHLDPDILLLDEVLAVGDLAFQQKCLKRVEGLTSEGRTVLFVSHSMEAIARFCDRCIWLDKGLIVCDGRAPEVIDAYLEALFAVQGSRQWVADDTGADPAAAASAARATDESRETTHPAAR